MSNTPRLKKLMSTEEFTLEQLSGLVPKKFKKLLTDETVEELNKCIFEPDYGEEFKLSYLSALHILEGKETWSLNQYMNAVQFYSLTAMGVTQIDAYVRIFPDRLKARIVSGSCKADMHGEASRFNGQDLVNRIRSHALVPLHLVNQGNVQLAINVLVDIAVNGRSEIARTSAALGMLKELRPPEIQESFIQIGLSDSAQDNQNKQTSAMLEIAKNQQAMLKLGIPLEDIQKIHSAPVIDAEVEED